MHKANIKLSELHEKSDEDLKDLYENLKLRIKEVLNAEIWR